MRLLLFTVLCVLTIVILRTVQRGVRPRASGHSRESAKSPPVARPDEIVDVPFEEFPKAEKTGKGAN
jgi:hypothetical protein